MVDKFYKGVKHSGKDLWSAIVDKYNNYNPPEIDKWIEGQADAYLDTDWDDEWIDHCKWDYRGEKVIVILEKIKGSFTIKKLKTMKLSKIKREAMDNFLEVVEKRYDRNNWAYERASNDFDCCIQDIDKREDKQVAEFFGLVLEIEGYDFGDGDCTGKDDCFICPDCDEPSPIKDQEGHNSFECNNCNNERGFNESGFLKSNKHLAPEVLLSKALLG